MRKRARPAKDKRTRGWWLALLFLLPALAPAQDDARAQLLAVRRIHVEKLSGGETAEQIQDMIISGLERTGLFVLTENPDRADAILRGSAEDLVYSDTHDTREGVDGRATISTGGARSSSSRRGIYINSGVGEDSSSKIVERKHEATAAVRLVNKDGDVVWSTTQESKGAKFRGASADVAEKVTRQLLADYQRARKRASASQGAVLPARPASEQPHSAGEEPPRAGVKGSGSPGQPGARDP